MDIQGSRAACSFESRIISLLYFADATKVENFQYAFFSSRKLKVSIKIANIEWRIQILLFNLNYKRGAQKQERKITTRGDLEIFRRATRSKVLPVRIWTEVYFPVDEKLSLSLR